MSDEIVKVRVRGKERDRKTKLTTEDDDAYLQGQRERKICAMVGR